MDVQLVEVIRNRINQLEQLRDTLDEGRNAAELTETESADSDDRVWVTARPSGRVTELFIDADWYRDCTANELAVAVLDAHIAASSAAADLAYSANDNPSEGKFDAR